MPFLGISSKGICWGIIIDEKKLSNHTAVTIGVFGILFLRSISGILTDLYFYNNTFAYPEVAISGLLFLAAVFIDKYAISLIVLGVNAVLSLGKLYGAIDGLSEPDGEIYATLVYYLFVLMAYGYMIYLVYVYGAMEKKHQKKEIMTVFVLPTVCMVIGCIASYMIKWNAFINLIEDTLFIAIGMLAWALYYYEKSTE